MSTCGANTPIVPQQTGTCKKAPKTCLIVTSTTACNWHLIYAHCAKPKVRTHNLNHLQNSRKHLNGPGCLHLPTAIARLSVVTACLERERRESRCGLVCSQSSFRGSFCGVYNFGAVSSSSSCTSRRLTSRRFVFARLLKAFSTVLSSLLDQPILAG